MALRSVISVSADSLLGAINNGTERAAIGMARAQVGEFRL